MTYRKTSEYNLNIEKSRISEYLIHKSGFVIKANEKIIHAEIPFDQLHSDLS